MIFDLIAGSGGVKSGPAMSDLFDVNLYAGNSAARTFNTGVDSFAETLLWTKQRTNVNGPAFSNSTLGEDTFIQSNATSMPTVSTTSTVSNFLNNGYSLNSGAGGQFNQTGHNYVNWSFKKAPKFFDAVSYAGDNTQPRSIPHELGVAPGLILIKQISGTSTDWIVYSNAVGSGGFLVFNSESGAQSDTGVWQSTPPTDTEFTIGRGGGAIAVNAGGRNYLGLLFANDTAADGAIRCGTSVSGTRVELGWAPQFLLYKSIVSGRWIMVDSTRGTGVQLTNYGEVESAQTAVVFDASGFTITNGSNSMFMAVRAP